MTATYSIPEPDAQAFKPSENREREIVRENQVVLNLQKVEYRDGEGIWLYYEDCPYPKKGFPFPKAGLTTNYCKRVLIEATKHIILSSPKKLVRSYINICYREMKPFMLKEGYYTPFAQQVLKFLREFLVGIGIAEDEAGYFAETIAAIFEYDDAYRYRLQDLFSESSKKRMTENPRKEILRLFDIYSQRETSNIVSEKFKRTVRILSLMLLMPKYRRAAVKAFQQADFERFAFDDHDRFWMCYRGDYDFFGETYEKRKLRVPKLKGYQIVI